MWSRLASSDPTWGTPPQQMAMLRAAIDEGDVPLPFGALAVLSCVADGILIENKQLDGNLIDAPCRFSEG